MPIAYVLITSDPGHEESVIKELEKIKEVTEIRGVYGRFDVFAKVESDNMTTLRNVVAGIRGVHKVHTTDTLIALLDQGGK